MNSVGSSWQKWDLHVHTPASFHWNGDRFELQTPAQQDASCKLILDKMNELDIAAFCIMDYWHFDGYLKLVDYAGRHSGCCQKKIFPGLEIRLATAADFRLNAHVLLNDELSTEKIRFFLSCLRFQGRPDKSLLRENFIEIAREYDESKLNKIGLKLADKADEQKMLVAGMKTALVSQDSVRDAIQQVGQENCLFILPYDTSDGVEGLDWQTHLYEDRTLMSWADIFETRKKVHVDLFLGRGHPKSEQIGIDFIANLGGYPKPVVSGSDAHRVADYGVYPSNRVTWIKAQPTFKGLRQLCHEPALRCHIGDRPEKLKHVAQNPTKYMQHLKLTKLGGSPLVQEEWFDGKEVELNPGLIAIIGNKGSGKSALADILALSGNAHCEKLEFLNDDRFRGQGNKAQYFEATLTWADGTPHNLNLAQDYDQSEPERVRYLPQHFIELLCNEIANGNDTKFNKELAKVIFNHVSPDNQLGCGTLDELLVYLVQSRRDSISQEQQALFSLNDTILKNEQESSPDTISGYEKSLALKQLELDAIDNVPLQLVEKPPEDPNNAETKAKIDQIGEWQRYQAGVNKQIVDLRLERQELVAEQATLNRLLGHIENFRAYHQTFVQDHSTEFEEAGFPIDGIITVTIDQKPIADRIEASIALLTEIDQRLKGKDQSEGQPAEKGLEQLNLEATETLAKLQEGLDAPQRAYQAYLKELEDRNTRKAAIIGAPDRPGTIDYFKERINRAKEGIPRELVGFRETRKGIVRRIHTKLLEIRAIYEELYDPVQKIATKAAQAAHSIRVDFDASVAVLNFEEDFLAYIHRGRVGNFRGDDESKSAVRDIIRTHNFNDSDSVVAFTEEVLEKLRFVGEAESRTTVSIGRQLRDETKQKQLYDFIFGLDYLDIRYNLKLGGKDISQLSPGEKGALLLVFYLLLDPEDIPIIIDQPEHNLDNESVVRLLVDCIRKARAHRQVIIVTHNPNLAVYCDADQIICCKIDKGDGHKITYSTGAIEDYNINQMSVNVLEGTYPAFDNRRKKYQRPVLEFAAPAPPVATELNLDDLLDNVFN